MTYRLAENVQVRRESWGLLFYLQQEHRVFFVRSGDWLHPQHFDGNWSFDRLADDISGRTGTAVSLIQQPIHKVMNNLLKNGMVVHELC